jgi:hypothetical protein
LRLDSVQVPVAQLSLAFARSQICPQLWQFASVLSGVSQPSAPALPLQLPKLGLQPMLQVPALHAGVPLFPLHGWLQPPQCSRLVAMLVSQPLVRLPSQSPNVPLHAMPHTPPLQAGVPPLELQILPQAPQFEVSLETDFSQPFAALPSQLPQPSLQTMPHAPPVQVGVPLVVPGAAAGAAAEHVARAVPRNRYRASRRSPGRPCHSATLHDRPSRTATAARRPLRDSVPQSS